MAECSLSSLKPGQSARIQRIEAAGAVRQRLQEMGLIRGTTVQFVRAAPLGDPLEIRVRGYHLTLRRSEADLVLVDGEAAGNTP